SYATVLRNTFYARGRLEFEAIAILTEIAIQFSLIVVGARIGAPVGFFVWAYAASFGFTCVYCLAVIPLFGLGRISLGFDLKLFPQSEASLRILSLGIVFLFANSAFTAMLFAIDRQDLFAWTTGIGVVVNVGLNLALIPLYGYLAASVTTVVTEAVISVAGWWFVARRHRLPWLRLSWRVVLAGLVMGAVIFALARR